MPNTLIGHTGFIGKNLKSQYDFSNLYNSSNIDKIINTSNKLTICAAPSATKWIVNKNPLDDLQNILNLFSNIQKSYHKKFVLISTIDVLTHVDVNESETINFSVNFKKLSYGINRLILEKLILLKIKNSHVIRLPALFGNHLKKNCFYDLINNNSFVENINLNHVYQWFYIKDLRKIIEYVTNNDIKVFNSFSEPIKMKEIVEKLFPSLINNCKGTSFVNYNFKSKNIENGYLFPKEQILKKMEDFLNDKLCI